MGTSRIDVAATMENRVEKLEQQVSEMRIEVLNHRERLVVTEAAMREFRESIARLHGGMGRIETKLETLADDTHAIISLTRGTKTWSEIGKYLITVGGSFLAAVVSTLVLMEKLGYLNLTG